MKTNKLPVAIIGAGPVGLAAAAHLIARGKEPLVLEAGSRVGASIRKWGHVRLFSPWRYAVDSASTELLAASGWESPDACDHPTGNDLLNQYLEPLAATPPLGDRIRLNTRVESVSRQGYDKMKTAGGERAPFALQIRDEEGREEVILARAVIDA